MKKIYEKPAMLVISVNSDMQLLNTSTIGFGDPTDAFNAPNFYEMFGLEDDTDAITIDLPYLQL